MFFKNIHTWSKKVMWTVTILFYTLYGCLLILAPAITIMTQYKVFEKTEHHQGLTGLGLVVAIVFGIGAFVLVKRLINKMPQESINEQRVKFGIEAGFDLLPLAAILYLLFCAKDDVSLAYNTCMICIWFVLAAMIVNAFFIRFIEAEWVIRRRAKSNVEEKKRESVV